MKKIFVNLDTNALWHEYNRRNMQAKSGNEIPSMYVAIGA